MRNGEKGIAAVVIAILAVAAWGMLPSPRASAEEAEGTPAAAAETSTETAPQAEAAPESKQGEETTAPKEKEARIKWWLSLTPEQRQKFIERYRKFEGLPAEQRKRIRERMTQWRQMPPERRAKIDQLFRRYRQLPPEDRQRFERRMQTWRSMPEQRRALIRRVLTVLKKLPGEEIERLKKLPAEERRKELVRILEENGVKLPAGAAERARPQGRPDNEQGPGPGQQERRRERMGEGRGRGGGPEQPAGGTMKDSSAGGSDTPQDAPPEGPVQDRRDAR